MKHICTILILFLLFFVPLGTSAQNEKVNEDEESSESVEAKEMAIGIIAKKLWIDYQGPLDDQPFDFQKWNGGFELGVRLPVNNWLDVAVPFKASSVSLFESQTNVNMFSLDVQAQIAPFNFSNTFKPYLATGIGGVLENEEDFHLAVPAAIGTNIRLNHRVDLNLELSYRFASEDQRDNYQLGLGFVYTLSDKEIEKPEEVIKEEVREELLDTDGDGIPDIYDLCPNTPGLAEFMGCPDTDGDGVPDHLDQCPNVPGPADNFGCPWPEEDEVPVEVEEEEVVEEPIEEEEEEEVEQVTEDRESDVPSEIQEVLDVAMHAVKFDLGRATLKPESFEILNQIAGIMKEHAKYNLRISGHTDNVGSESNNQRLSEQRARSCYEYLASRGVSPSRMSFIGYGESRPLNSNDTAQGRANNRRVEFNLYLD